MHKPSFAAACVAGALLSAVASCSPDESAKDALIAQMRMAYDDLNGLLLLAEERFQNATRNLEERTKTIESLLARIDNVNAQRRRIEASSQGGRNVLAASEPRPLTPASVATTQGRSGKDATMERIQALEERLHKVEQAQAQLLEETIAKGEAALDKSLKLFCAERRK